MVSIRVVAIHIALFSLAAAYLWNGWRGAAEEKAAAAAAAEVQLLVKRAAAKVDQEHLRCLATNIYWEAAGEPFMGQVAVARVVLNRVRSGFAPSPCKVVYQSHTVPDLDSPNGVRKVCQFSWVCEGKGQPPKNQVYRQAEDIASQVLAYNKWSEQVPQNILFFHNTGVDPQWGYKKVMEVGNHIFYSRK